MRIAVIVEGKTERAFLPHLRRFLETRLADSMPRIDVFPYNGLIPTGAKLKRVVENLLEQGRSSADHVIALTDVYTGANPPVFTDAADAKAKIRSWVGTEPRFHPHAAQHDFEAWLLPYWPTILRLAEHNRAVPGENPEMVNHNNPPAHRIKEVFRTGKRGNSYIKPRDAGRILRDNDLSVAIGQCAELRAFVNTLLTVSGGYSIP